MMQQMQLPLPNECDSQTESGSHVLGVGVLCGWGGAVFTYSFHPPLHVNGEEGNRCQRSRRSTKAPDCILDSDMLLFFNPTRKLNVLVQQDRLID